MSKPISYNDHANRNGGCLIFIVAAFLVALFFLSPAAHASEMKPNAVESSISSGINLDWYVGKKYGLCRDFVTDMTGQRFDDYSKWSPYEKATVRAGDVVLYRVSGRTWHTEIISRVRFGCDTQFDGTVFMERCGTIIDVYGSNIMGEMVVYRDSYMLSDLSGKSAWFIKGL